MTEVTATRLGSDMVELILTNVADGVFAVDADFRITYFNPAAEQITGFSRGEAIGRPCFEIFRTSLCHEDCPLRRSIRTRQKVSNFEIDILTSTRQRQTVSVSTAPLLDADGTFVGGVETFRDLSPIQELRRAIREQYTFADVVAKSEPMRQLVAAVPNIAHSSAPVLLEGGAGTGKELIATAIHNAGRREGPFVRVGCGSLGDQLLESELFGSGARQGRIEAARSGTLLLDDVADIPLPLQAKLLRALEEGGDDRARVIAATKHDLKLRVREGVFREDLYYRLNVVALRLPPLCERAQDIPHLVEHFVECLNLRMGRNIQGLTDAAMAVLLRYPFPGNVRELENALEHAYIVAPGRRIGASDLSPHVHAAARSAPAESPAAGERAELVACLERNHWSVPRAASELGVHRTTLWRKLKRHGIERP